MIQLLFLLPLTKAASNSKIHIKKTLIHLIRIMLTSTGKLINIRRNCNKGEAHACDCVLQVCVRKLSTNGDLSRIGI